MGALNYRIYVIDFIDYKNYYHNHCNLILDIYLKHFKNRRKMVIQDGYI